MSIAVLVPTRGRPWAARRLAAAFRETKQWHDTRLLFCVDEDDPHLQAYREVDDWVHGASEYSDVEFIYGEPARLAAWHNRIAPQIWGRCDVLGSWGDDHLPRTRGWDAKVRQAFADPARPALVYGDDGLQGAALPTAAFLRSTVVKAFGYWVPPRLEHLYIDNYWDEIGKAFGRRYLPEVKIEHLHWQNGKAVNDETYQRGTAATVWVHDQAEFELYMAHRWEAEVGRVRQILAQQQNQVVS